MSRLGVIYVLKDPETSESWKAKGKIYSEVMKKKFKEDLNLVIHIYQKKKEKR